MLKTPTVSILVPTVKRAQAIIPFTDAVRQTTPLGAYEIVFITDPGDKQTLGVISGPVAGRDTRMVEQGGSFPQKINAGAANSKAPFVLCCGDDVIFRAGWWEALDLHLAGDVGVIGTNDLTPRTKDKNHATAQVVARSYIDDPGAAWREPGHVFHEGYHHNFADDELCRLAIFRGLFVFVEDCHLHHLHPIWGTKDWDEIYEKGQQHYDRDRDLYRKRRRAWILAARRSR